MFVQIISHTPLWVWALLAYLIYRGVLASADREVALNKLFVIPIVMLMLSLQGIVTIFGITLLTLACWVACAGLATALSWSLFRPDQITPHPARGTLFLRGSWLPMCLMLGIFVTKYVVNVMLAVQPALAQQVVFAAVVCALYGMFNGIFIGKLARTVVLYRAAEQTVTQGNVATS